MEIYRVSPHAAILMIGTPVLSFTPLVNLKYSKLESLLQGKRKDKMKKAHCWCSQATEWVLGTSWAMDIRRGAGFMGRWGGEEDRHSCRHFREVCVCKYIYCPVGRTSRLETVSESHLSMGHWLGADGMYLWNMCEREKKRTWDRALMNTIIIGGKVLAFLRVVFHS